MLLLNGIYLYWVVHHLNGPWGWFFYFAEIGLFSIIVIFSICHWTRKYQLAGHKKHSPFHPPVDIFIPCYNEPLEMIQKTVTAATHIKYPYKTVFLLDDGKRDELKQVAHLFGIRYLRREKNEHAKAGNLNHALANSTAPFILVLDADQVAYPRIIEALIHQFETDTNIAFVTTCQQFDIHEKDFNNDYLFYEHIQAGKNADGCPISTGSAVIYRRSALEKIGGFSTWNLVEDLTTSYELHQQGYRSVYIGTPYSCGTAPQDLRNVYKQRGTWAVDSLRIFFLRNPLFAKKLTFLQRMHYFEITYNYIVSGIYIPLLYIIPTISLFLNFSVVTAGYDYLAFRIPGLVAITLFFADRNRTHEYTQYWTSLWPVYIKAIFLALHPKKMTYKVTQKIEIIGRRINEIKWQTLLLATGIFAVFYNYQHYGFTSNLAINCVWIGLELVWTYPIIIRGFSKRIRHQPRLHTCAIGAHA